MDKSELTVEFGEDGSVHVLVQNDEHDTTFYYKQVESNSQKYKAIALLADEIKRLKRKYES